MERVIPPRMNSATVTQDTGPRASSRSVRLVWRATRAARNGSGRERPSPLTPTVLPYRSTLLRVEWPVRRAGSVFLPVIRLTRLDARRL
jgi:hypothetical protein